jgi:hypothetical protein
MLCTCMHRVLCRSLSSRVKMAVFWVVAPCGPAEVDQRFRGTNCKSVHSCIHISIWRRKICHNLWYAWPLVVVFVLLPSQFLPVT